MFGSIGVPELIIILTIALIIFGPRKLPELGRSLGRSLNEFKRASNELRHTLDEEIRLEDEKSEQRQRPPVAALGAAQLTQLLAHDAELIQRAPEQELVAFINEVKPEAVLYQGNQ